MLLMADLFGRGHPGGATLAVMGIALGASAGVAAGRWLGRLARSEADTCLPVVLGLLCLPLAVLPAAFDLGWVLLAVVAALPLGLCLGVAWRWRAGRQTSLSQSTARRWMGVGLGLGGALSAASAALFSSWKGSMLTMLFAAPLVWPILPSQGARSLLARMILTLLVVVATMFLLFT
ncbi:MAG: hypothetical protein JXR96_22790 [Deltaproteobacteria bacterium]|nr:hypothetical protein [Deltaproteobacteria bacterium]